jgi:hypothetical protein
MDWLDQPDEPCTATDRRVRVVPNRSAIWSIPRAEPLNSRCYWRIADYLSPEGTPLVTKELLHLGSRAAVDQVLSPLVRRGTLLRAGRGVHDVISDYWKAKSNGC